MNGGELGDWVDEQMKQQRCEEVYGWVDNGLKGEGKGGRTDGGQMDDRINDVREVGGYMGFDRRISKYMSGQVNR